MRSIQLLSAALLLSACGPREINLYERQGDDIWQQSPTDKVDILWVIDNSNSMQIEQSLLAEGFLSFANELENTNTNFHLGVITTDFEYTDADRGKLVGEPSFITNDDDYINIFRDRALVGLNGSGKEKGLEAARHALSTQMTTGPNRGFLRPEANLLVVFVSDEDDCSDGGRLEEEDPVACYSKVGELEPVEDYVAEFQALKSSRDAVRIGAIVGPEEGTDARCDENTYPGRRYIEMSRLMGGITGSICQPDWGSFLFDLGLNATGIHTTFFLSHGAKEGTLVVTVDGNEVPESPFDGYIYDSEAHSITFTGVWIPERGVEITANYTIEPGT